MRNKILGFFCMVVLFACKTKEVVKQVPETPKPHWVESRPLNNLDYIGIAIPYGFQILCSKYAEALLPMADRSNSPARFVSPVL